VCSIINAFKDTHTENRYPYNPSNLYKSMRDKKKNLLDGKQQDAQEFWSQIMEAIEIEPNSVLYNKLFSHETVTMVKCVYCNTISDTKQICIGHVIRIQGTTSVHEAVDTYFAEDILDTYECEACSAINKDMAKKTFVLKSIPNILCLVLNRFENKEKKICNSITLNKELKLSDHILSGETANIIYKLVSVVNHIGANLSNGHYTTTICVPNNLFYEFDDNRVGNTDAISGSNAYILIYELSCELSTEVKLS
jgi:ubiquitin C-terminal hydrolase